MPDREENAGARIEIGDVRPCFLRGRVPIRRVVGDWITVSAEIATDRPAGLRAAVLFKHETDSAWRFAEMRRDAESVRWLVSFKAAKIGRYSYTVEAWFDPCVEWLRYFRASVERGLGLKDLLAQGAELARLAAGNAGGADGRRLAEYAGKLGEKRDEVSRGGVALSRELAELMAEYGPREDVTAHEYEYSAVVERPKARFSSWYHFFTRSLTPDASRPGTLLEAAEHLPRISRLGFDIALIAPIHSIGKTRRKGAGGNESADPGDPGSPYAVGNAKGGHKEIDPALGTLADFETFVERARELGIEVGLDLACQCSPDHPWVKSHPDWFIDRASAAKGTHPDDRFSDLQPMDFGCEDWKGLWEAWLDVVLTWCGRGIRAFRIDRPHGRPVEFWEWLLAETRANYPDTIFLAESFTRPAMVRQLARAGFSQCMTYFTWRNSRDELARHHVEFMVDDEEEHFQACLFTNTPDVLSEYLQEHKKAGFLVRATLAATMGSCWGIYSGFENCEAFAVPGTEDYADSEKFRILPRKFDTKEGIGEFIARLNRIRRENPALQTDAGLRLHRTDNSDVLFYTKTTPDFSNTVLIVVNLNAQEPRTAWLEVPIAEFGIGENEVFQVHDLVSDVRYLWQGKYCKVEIDPAVFPANVFVLRRRVSRETGFDYFS